MSVTTRAAWSVAILFLLSVAAACGDADDPNDGRVLTDTTAPGSSTGAPATVVQADQAKERVKRALDADSVLKSFDLEAESENGQIVIEGKVRTAAQKSLAEQVARGAAGGLTVVNRVSVE